LYSFKYFKKNNVSSKSIGRIGIGATSGVLGGSIVSPVKKLIIEKLCEKIVFFLFHIVIFI
jgi:hypothetical protein